MKTLKTLVLTLMMVSFFPVSGQNLLPFTSLNSDTLTWTGTQVVHLLQMDNRNLLRAKKPVLKNCQKYFRILQRNIYLKIMNITINFMMMRKIILFLTGFGFLNLYAQEQPAPQEISIAQEDVQKIRQHLAQNYRIPTKVLLDSIRRINYQISFTIDEEGRIVEPNIIYKNSDCSACERELFRVLKTTPAVRPVVIDNKKVKSLYQLPFNIMLE